jgi:DHA1 family bicyclomycin/chloramphenicol resistance-like MFS transporter
MMVVAMFVAMVAHGINFPVTQSGAIAPFPAQAGTAAGLMGALFMLFAFIIGSVVGATHNGTLYPLALIVCLLGTLNFFSARAITLKAAVA